MKFQDSQNQEKDLDSISSSTTHGALFRTALATKGVSKNMFALNICKDINKPAAQAAGADPSR